MAFSDDLILSAGSSLASSEITFCASYETDCVQFLSVWAVNNTQRVIQSDKISTLSSYGVGKLKRVPKTPRWQKLGKNGTGQIYTDFILANICE